MNIDIPRLRTCVNAIYEKFQPALKDGYDTYGGIGLQYSDARNPVYDAVEQTSYTDPSGITTHFRPVSPRDFSRRNKIGDYVGFVFDAFPGVPLFRARILRASPGHVHAEHIDGPTDCRIHVPVITNKFCLFYFGDKPFYLPADGSAYLINTSLIHQVVNFSKEERTHFVFVL